MLHSKTIMCIQNASYIMQKMSEFHERLKTLRDPGTRSPMLSEIEHVYEGGIQSAREHATQTKEKAVDWRLSAISSVLCIIMGIMKSLKPFLIRFSYNVFGKRTNLSVLLDYNL